jgi:hypothetical protein
MGSAMVVLPAYGVGDGVVTVIRDLAVAAYALRARGMHLEVLLLDDGTSEVASVASKTAAEYGLPLTAISGPRSPAEAYLVGFRQVLEWERGDLVVTLDATGQHDATQIPHLIDQLLVDDLDVVIGSRWARGSGTPTNTSGTEDIPCTHTFATKINQVDVAIKEFKLDQVGTVRPIEIVQVGARQVRISLSDNRP